MISRPFSVRFEDTPLVATGSVRWAWAGEQLVTVVAKRAYRFDAGGALAPIAPAALRQRDEHIGGRSLARETWPFATRVSVVVHGRALAPTLHPVGRVEIGAVLTRNGARLAAFTPRLAGGGERASMLTPRHAAALQGEALDLPADFPRTFFDAAQGAEGMAAGPLEAGDVLSVWGTSQAGLPVHIDLAFAPLVARARTSTRAAELLLTPDLLVLDTDQGTLEVVSRAALSLEPGETDIHVEIDPARGDRADETQPVRAEDLEALLRRSPLPFSAPRAAVVDAEVDAEVDARAVSDATQSIAWDVRKKLAELGALPFADGPAELPPAAFAEHVDTGTTAIAGAQIALLRDRVALVEEREPLLARESCDAAGADAAEATDEVSKEGGIGAAFLDAWRH